MPHTGEITAWVQTFEPAQSTELKIQASENMLHWKTVCFWFDKRKGFKQ